MHAKCTGFSLASIAKKLKKKEENFDAYNALEDPHTMIASSQKQPWAAEFIKMAPLP